MNISLPVPSTVTSLSFSFLTAEDVRRISVKQITNPILLDDLNRPNIGGLYDPALGPSDRKDICATCHLTYYTCPGHFGHIELPITVFHPLFMTNMYNVLRATCLFCHKFKLGRAALIKFVAKLRLLEHGQLDAMHTLDDVNLGLDSKKDLKTMDQDTNDTSADSLLDYERRINLFITAALARAGNSKRDHYKDPLVYQSRKDLISSFLKTSYLKKCQRCSAHSYTFRKEGHTKIIEYDLSAKQKKEHIAMNLSRPNVFSRQNQYLNPSKKNHRESTVISEEDESSEDEDLVDSISEVNEGYDSGEVQVEAHLPKAANGKTKSSRGRNERVITPDECRTHLRLLFMNEKTACSLLFGRHGPLTPLLHDGFPTTLADMFFIEVIAVTPTRFRPPAKMADTLFEHPHNLLLAKILSTAYRIRDVNDELNIMMAKGSTSDKEIQQRIYFSLLEGLIQLQVDVNSFIDSSKNPTPMRQGRVPPPGVKQGLEKKEGLFRMNMMGKRVNFAARSVISPDVNIEPSEIGIPPIFARKLTFPDPVTNHNVHDMRQLIINGPYEYPGASMVQYEDGNLQLLDKLNIDERKALANQLLTPQRSDCYTASSPSLSTRAMATNKKVYRHLQDGDMLILNRQPTLHKPSMMAHKARVLQGEKTIRMHYANCNSYNADFDGDEMNIHFPQNYVAIAEAQLIANTDNQYLVPTSGKPLRGLIQDHVVAGVWMTSKEAFFTREEYHQLLYGSLRPEEDPYLNRVLQTLPPAIWKPRPLWTGKQIISTILLNITPYNAEGLNLISKAKISGDLWGKNSEEGTVIFSEGEMLCGVLDKSQFGATDYGVVHSVYDLYGSEVAGKFLGILSRLFTKFLQHRAFTCRMDDLALTNEGENRRKDIFVTAHNIGADAAMDNFPSLASLPKSEKRRALEDLMNDVLRDDEKMAGLDVTVKKQLAVLTKSITDACMPNGLMRRFPFNHMQMMTQSGAKGSAVNAQQITCALGQQELEGRRVPVMVSGKTLPSFKAFETAAIAGGYVASRFLTGVKPQEFYFHCMAGREGLIDTAVKTSRSGYLQRCLIKHMEGIRVHYDYTVRGSDSSVYQFCYGGDALDVTRSRHLHQFDFNAMNYISLVNLYQSRHIAEIVNDEDAMRHNKKLIKLLDRQTNPDSKISQVDLAPALSLYNPSRYLGATSDIFAKKLHDYIRSNPEKYLKTKENVPVPYSSHLPKKVTSNQFRLLMNVRYMRSLAEPGEAVGLLAAQGVGEPSTQMTLNTFHFAGHGAANVTLGIPRLREIVMTASTKPKTPIMNMKLCDGVPIEKAQYFCKKASLLTLSQVTDYITVKESLSASRKREYSVDITFYPAEEYTKEYDVKSAELLAVFGTKFPLTLRKEIQSEMKKLAIDFRTHMKEMGKGRGTESRGKDDQEEHVDDDEERNLHEKEVGSEIGDGDADDIKRSKQRKEEISYDSDDQEVDDLEEYADEDIEANYEEDSNPDDEDQPIDSLKDQSKLLSSQMERITALFLQNFSWATSFFFSDTGVSFRIELDSDLPKLLLIGLVEQSSIKTIVREIPGIKECFTTKDNAKDQRVQIITNGSNLRGIWDFNHTFKDTIDVDSIYTNDIFAILHTYGVEMARAAIFKEISAVFGAYNIDVNERHLELIADYMTFNGDYKAFNRTGIATNPSPLLKASYETTGAFLSDATLYGDYDDLSSPSSTIVLGKPNLTGTGVFDIVQSLPQ